MSLTDNNAVQLWRKAECHARNATNLMLAVQPDALPDTIDKTLRELRNATCAMQELQRRSVGVPPPKTGD